MTVIADSSPTLCAPFLAALPIVGVSICVTSDRGARSTIGASDAIAGRLEELQFQLGEGPIPDVLRSGRAALEADLAALPAQRAWPTFSAAASALGARGLFSVPMRVGRLTIGVASMYALVLLPPWSGADLRVAARLAEQAVDSAIQLATRSARSDTPLVGQGPSEMRREVHQATGMVTVQLDCGADEALLRLRAHAFRRDLPLDEIARGIVTRALRLTQADD